MTQAGYVIAGYAATVGVLAAYSLRVVRRERNLARRLGGGGGPGRPDSTAAYGDVRSGATGGADDPRC